MYKPASVVVSKVSRNIGIMANNWREGVRSGIRDWEEWYKYFKENIEGYLAGKAGQTLETEEELNGLYNEIRRIARDYHASRR